MTASSDVAAPGDRVAYTVIVTNTGATDLLNVSAQVRLPQFAVGATALGTGFGCSGSGVCSWAIGTLAPGENRIVSLSITVHNNATPGIIITSTATASASNASDVITSVDVAIDPSPLLRLSLVPDPAPASASQAFTYTLTFSNIGTASPTDVVLRMTLPEGTTLTSATGGGTEQGDVLTWNLGTVGPGAGGQIRVSVLLENALANGSVLRARAELDSGLATETVVHATAVTPIRNGVALHLAGALSQTSARPGDRVTYTVTATNTGTSDLPTVSALLRLPPFAVGATALGTGFGCSGSGVCSWAIGTLAPGENRIVSLSITVHNNATLGEVLRSEVVASAPGNQAALQQDVHVDPSPLLRLSLVPDPAPASASQAFTYTLTFSNIGTASPTDVVLRMTLPEGTTLTSATGGGTEQGDVLTWNLGTVGPGAGGQVHVTVMPDASLGNGSVLRARAELDSGLATETVVHATAVTPIRNGVALHLAGALSQTSARPGDRVTYTVTATNTGTSDLPTVSALLRLPPFAVGATALGTGFGCSGSGVCSWAIGTLAPGENRIVSLSITVHNNATLGEVLRSEVVASAPGNQAALQQDVLVGTFIATNQPASPAVITSPEDGAFFVIGGGEGEDPVSPGIPFVVIWNTSIDPEGDVLSYTWQLAISSDFSSLLMEAPSASGGTALRFETSFGILAQRLTDHGVALWDSIVLYHRVVTSDGVNQTLGSPVSITLQRGTLVSVDETSGLPKTFALHDNYPNPFNPTTTFQFDLPEPARVRLDIYDMVGREIDTVVSGQLPAGTFRYVWHAGNLPSGVYLYRLHTESYTEAKKFVLLK